MVTPCHAQTGFAMTVEELIKTQSRDARLWAEAFCKATKFSDVDWAHGWFANAMMAMYDSVHNNELKIVEDELSKTLKNMAELDELYTDLKELKCSTL